MKTLQPFVLVVLLFAAKTYSQDGIASEVDKESIITKSPDIENTENLVTIVDDNVSASDHKTIQEILPENQQSQNEDIPAENSEVQETSTIESESSTEIPIDIETSIPAEIASETPTEISTEVPQETAPETPEITNENPPEIIISEPEPELPENISEQTPLETPTCTCDCGVDSDRPQKCDENPLETANPENGTDQPITSSLVPEDEKEPGDQPIKAAESDVPSEVEISTPEAELSKPNTEEKEPPPAVENTENSEASASNDESKTETTTSPKSEPESETSDASQVNADPSNNPEDVTATTINPCMEVGNFANPTNCRQYLSCSGNATNLIFEELQCPEKCAFNPTLGRCSRDLSPCLDEEPVCIRAGSIPNPNGENSSYFWCVPSLLEAGFHKYHIQCSENEVFIPLIGRCWVNSPQLGLGFGFINNEPSDREIVRAEWKLLRKELKLKQKEEKLQKKVEEKARARAEKLAAKELRKQKADVRTSDEEDEDSTSYD